MPGAGPGLRRFAQEIGEGVLTSGRVRMLENTLQLFSFKLEDMREMLNGLNNCL